MMTVKPGPIRRWLTSVMLAGLAVSHAAPLLGGGSASLGCPLPPGGNGAPVLVAGMDDGACEHTAAAPCVTTLGCVTAAPAIRPAAVALIIPARLIALGGAPVRHLGDLCRTGPPTPPPNQI